MQQIRLCSKWWEKSLRAFRCARTRLDKEEDKEMDQNLQQQPLPRSIAELVERGVCIRPFWLLSINIDTV